MTSEEVNHPSYHNRYRLSSGDIHKDLPRRGRRASSLSENMEEDLYNGAISSHGPAASHVPVKKNLSRMTSDGSRHSDDVFVQIEHKRSAIRTTSTASAASILPNPYNTLNHKFHSGIWCSCCFYFVFLCCMPAVRFMEMSDEEFRKGNDKLAEKYGRRASVCYVLGAIVSVVIYACILFLIIYFSLYLTN